MTEQAPFDVAIIGGGPGGYVAAIRAAQLGARVALVEKDRLGGTCLHRGCIPTKALLRSAEALLEARDASTFGVVVREATVDFGAMMARKRQVVAQQVEELERLIAWRKIAVLPGEGRLVGPGSIKVGDELVAAGKIIVATGSLSTRLPVPGASLPGVLTSDEILELEALPERLVVIGAGVIGCEFASIFSALGARVTIIEVLPRILPPVDEEIARRCQQILRGQGITIHTSASLQEIRAEGERLRLLFGLGKEQQEVVADRVLMAVGRRPCSDDLEEAGLALRGGSLAVNERLETSVQNVYAAGDVLGLYMLAYVASYQGIIAAENALGGRRQADYRAVPNCVYTLPEVASVGLREEEARAQGVSYKVSRFPFSALARAQILGQPSGLVKLICEEPSGRVLGVHILGPRATDIIGEGVLALQMGATAQDLAHTMHGHPNLSEAIYEAAWGIIDSPFHLRRL
ncbi:MAG: dihydrolipoyl dehydrogenase [Dehalococcoidia bacterium]|nr:dihydrolipoyl dehydrogenase [Dehalococcoidia bacterium]